MYDTFDPNKLHELFHDRSLTLSCLKTTASVRYVHTTAINSLKEFWHYHKTFNKNGFEGSIIRLYDGPYELGHRSRSLLKYKDFKDDEFEIIGFTEGTGKFEGCVTWICKTKDNKTFNVVPKGTLHQKKKWFSEAEKYIGKEITVKYQSFSKDGIPEFPVGIGLRLKEDK